MSTAIEMRDAYIEAEKKIILGQECRWEGRLLKRADLEWVQRGRREWERKVCAEQAAAAGANPLGMAVADLSC